MSQNQLNMEQNRLIGKSENTVSRWCATILDVDIRILITLTK